MTALGPELQAEMRDAAFEAAYEFGLSAANSTLEIKDFEQAFRAGFVRAAIQRITQSGTEATPARVAVLCGLTRSSVEQAMAAVDSYDRDRHRDSFDESGIFEGLSLLLSLWNSDPRFTQIYGVPRDLLIRRSSGDTASLEDAAAIALPAVPFDQVLTELTDRGLIALDRTGGTAKLINDVMPIADYEARAAVRFNRLTAGLMRTLRVNYENRAEQSRSRRMWEKSFWTDRPIAKSRTQEFLAFADQSVRKWLARIDSNQRTYSARNDETARQYCIAVFANTRAPDRDGLPQTSPPLLHTIMTSVAIRDVAARDFMSDVNDSASMWLNALNTEQLNLVAAPGEPGDSIEICAFMFDVAGSKGDAYSKSIDLLEPRYARR